MHSRRLTLISVLMLFVLLASACAAPVQPATGDTAADEAEATGPQEGGTLNMSFGEDFVTFHPFYDVTNGDFKPIFFEAPLRITNDGGFEPWLAESYEVAEDGRSITLNMRSGVMFHNGREMTAEDVAWSVELACNQEIGHHLADRFTTCESVEQVDEDTVTVHYAERTASALDALARLYIFPQEAQETIETEPVGTGPFQFVEWIPGDRLTAEAFDDYWQEGLPYLDEVVISAIPDPQSRLVNLRSQTIDMLYYVPLIELESLREEPEIITGEAPPGFSFFAFIMNVQTPPFDNVQVRQAFQYAIDREEIAETVFYGEAPVVTVPYAPSSWAYAEDLEDYYTHDPERAQELLAEAGYPDGFSIEMVIRGNDGPHLEQALVFQQQLAEIGVDVELVPTELPQYWPILFESDFSIVSHKTGDATIDPSGLFEGAACCRPFRNFFGVEDLDTEWYQEYVDIIAQARRSNDQAERADLYRQALEVLMEQAWTIPTVWEQDIFAHWDYVQDLRTDLDGAIWLHETWLDN